MNKFTIGDTDFGIGSVECIRDVSKHTIAKLEISADPQTYAKVSAQEAYDFRYLPTTLPVFYMLDCNEKHGDGEVTVDINGLALSRSEIGLYFVDENPVKGTLTIKEGSIELELTAEILEEEYPVHIVTEFKQP